MGENPLGRKTPLPRRYAPGVLHPIPRALARERLGIGPEVPMHGFDHWHAWEVSWLNPAGRPQAAVAEFRFDAASVNIVESKSLKLYLHSLHQEKISDAVRLAGIIREDLSALSQSPVEVRIHGLAHAEPAGLQRRQGCSLDELDVPIDRYHPDPGLLSVSSATVDHAHLYSDLFRSMCPITGAPDWASIGIHYSGAKIDEAGLLAYLCSFREHPAWHEECGERIYVDLMQHCRPRQLAIALNFLRRGGLDINVYRSNAPLTRRPEPGRLIRQ